MIPFTKKNSILFFVFCCTRIWAQTADVEYFTACRKGFGFYEVKKYRESADAYAKAFQISGARIKDSDRYNAACSWALAGYPDSAYSQLYLAATKGKFTDYLRIIEDPDLKSLQNDRRWKPLLDSLQKHKEKNATGLHGHLTRLLESIIYSDQKYRGWLEAYEKKYGFDSKEVKGLWDTIRKEDEANLKIVTRLLDEHGWLGADVVGERGNSALFLVIQHSDQKTQEKYLPLMREAVKKGNAEPSSLALLEDRVALAQGKDQIYGSQLRQDPETGKYVLSPIEDEANVNKRRAEVGLGPIEEYVKQWGIAYKFDAGSVEKTGFWQKNKAYLLVVSVIFLFCFITYLLFRFFQGQIVGSALYWLYAVLFFLFLYGWQKELHRPGSFQQDPIKLLFYYLTGFSVVVISMTLVNFCLNRSFKRKHLIFELLAVATGSMLLTLLAGSIYKLFYPNGHVMFYFTIIPTCIILGIFLIIKLVHFLVLKKLKKLK